MTMLHPTYEVSLGAVTLSTEALGPLVSLTVERAKNAGADAARVRVGRAGDATPSLGDPASVALGWDGDTTPVFTGVVDAVRPGVDGLDVTCAGMQLQLIAARGDQAYLQQTAGGVVRTLAQGAGLDLDTVEDGAPLPVYQADSRRHAFDHCLDLALRSGFDCYTTESGALVFAPFRALPADHTFRFGIDVLSAWVERAVPDEGLAVVPESASSSTGDDTSSWLSKDAGPYRGTAGGTATRLRSDPALRTKEAADSAAAGWLGRLRRGSVEGSVELMGAPQVTLGQAVALADMPDDDMNDTYQVMAVRHVLDRRRGFRTFVALAGMPEEAS